MFLDGAAYKAGIKKGDVLLSINDIKVKSISHLKEQIVKYSPRDKIKCQINRNGRIIDFILKLS